MFPRACAGWVTETGGKFAPPVSFFVPARRLSDRLLSANRPLKKNVRSVTLRTNSLSLGQVLHILWHAGGWALAFLFRLLPRRARFRAACRVSFALQPVIRRSRAFALREQLGTDSIRETSLDLLLLMLTRHGTEFDLELIENGGDLLRAGADGRPTLLVGPHAMLVTLVVRLAHDLGFPLIAVSSEPFRIPGTRLDARVLVPTRTFLVTVREYFARGMHVGALIDRGEAGRRNATVSTTRGAYRVSTPLLEIGLRNGARILFVTAVLDRRRKVRMTIEAPTQGPSTTVDELVGEFVAFVERHVLRPTA